MAEEERRLFAVPSGGRILRVEAPEELAVWWHRIAPHLPGVRVDGIRPMPSDGGAVAVVPNGMGMGDARRLLNAHLHRLHLTYGTLCIHAVTLRHCSVGGAVVLLGGHGAGKTLVALALVERGWRIVAGDVTLLDCCGHGAFPAVLGGTRAFLARRAPVRRWFPDLQLTAAGSDKVDLSSQLGLLSPEPSTGPGTVAAAVMVDVDGDLHAGDGAVEELDRHTAVTVWLRASGHLLDRVLEDSDVALRQFEDGAAARRRVAQVRVLAEQVPLHAAWGVPRKIAAHVERLAAADSEPGRRRAQ
jgi:hypothetical protein